MDRQHSADFELELTAVLEMYDKPKPSKTALRMWWIALDAVPFANVKAALGRHVQRGKFAPKPADILEIVREQDGRPGAEEAWTMAVQSFDEQETVILSREVFEARNLCRQLYEDGDKVGARMAFKQHYERLIEKARQEQVPAHWTLTLGSDAQRRHAAVTRARDAGLIGREQSEHLLPDLSEPSGPVAAVAGLLTGNVVAFPDGGMTPAAKRAMAEMRKLLESRSGDARRDQAREDAEQHKADELRRLEELRGSAT